MDCYVVVADRGTKIAHDIYHVKAESRIVKAKWHPWGEHGTSLLVLTDDTILR
jgi:nucleoporin NUP82